MPAQTSIHVPALLAKDRTIIIPEFWLGDIEYKTNAYFALSADKYNTQMQLPTLAELRRAFFGGSKDYRRGVRSKRGYGEWTSTFLRDGKEAVERPENVVYRNCAWILEGGKVTPVELPPEGWALEYDKPTGFPSRTSQKRKDAERVFGGDTSYFYAKKSGVRAVLRCFGLDGNGPFYVDANNGPGDGDWYVGGRACRRETDALFGSDGSKRGVIPVYEMGQTEYEALTRLSRKNHK